jgi:glycosyltransferase involved in cell wall biosynthesis
MNILQIVSAGDINGAVVHCALLTRELVRRGHNVTLVCKPHAWAGQQVAGLPVEVVRSDLHRWPLDELRRIGQIARERNIDVIHTHMSRAHAFGVMLRMRSGIPCVATAHNRYVQLHWMFNDFVIGNSTATTKFHRRYNLVRRSRSRTIPIFIDEQAIAGVGDGARQRLRQSFGIEPNHVMIGQIGDVIPRKGLLYLVRSLKNVLAQNPQVRLLVVGQAKNSADYLEQVKREAEKLGVAHAIQWAGQRRDVADLLAAIDVVALASLEESLGLSLLEAMAAARPVVASRVGGIPEVVADGETGLLVPATDTEALAAGIVRLAADPALRTRLGNAGQARVAAHFSTAAITDQIESVYRQVAAKGRRQAA